mmetsp:Transcript_1984/g.4580  ORF Transcript_1984/g.4580 Transcript_1984/m.4580 type:complete len:208 (-) Transcript_1984:325-948(-)|eukprot:CAMPEP_0178489434 /NCGR_PEP_ID=MMETSP0696-20121128/10374_1 /TAXON_ID=265572 /ORGANISM="Extubocellulus spinifer, Strain CCMP396" /LENGTH=207 /DNA_ID=CAMNT_0020117235 /DNA_START=121 /DNA_END=744 /DNA_ORIENTATION=+
MAPPFRSSVLVASALLLAVAAPALSFSVQRPHVITPASPSAPKYQTQKPAAPSTTALHVFGTEEKSETKSDTPGTEADAVPSVDETTEKYGLEAGLFQSLRSEDGGASAKDLLAKYGVAYLATSIPLAIVSFALCYLLVDNGVDVAALLSKVGINVGDAGEKAGTVAIAYAAHKAASPIRFPPTVILTPVVAKLIGKEPNETEEVAE